MRSTLATRLTAVLPLFLLQAASLASQAPDSAIRVRQAVSRRTDVIAAEEIRSVETGQSAFETLRRLRPEFLRRAAVEASDPEEGFPVVYLDGIRLGGLETLKDVPTGSIREIRYLRAAAAYERFGRQHRGGVIAVTTHR